MARAILGAGRGSNSTTSGTGDYYTGWGGTAYLQNGLTGGSSGLTSIVRAAGTIRNLRVRVSSNTHTGSSTVRSRVNGSDANLSISIPASTTGSFTDTSNSDSVSSGDVVGVHIATASTGSAQFTAIAAVFDSTSAHGFLGLYGGPGFSGGTTYRLTVGSGTLLANSTAETQWQRSAVAAYTLANLRFYVVSNSANNSATARLRKGGANGNQVITIPSATTGAFEDTDNSDSIAAGDLVNFNLVTTSISSGSFAAISLQARVTPATADQAIVAAGAGATSWATGNTQTVYVAPWGGFGSTAAYGTESVTQFPVPADGTAAKLTVRCYANGGTKSLTVTSRKNGSAGAMSVTVTAGTTGVFADTTNSDSLVAGDLYDFQLVPSGSGGTLGITGLEAVYTAPSTVAADPGRGDESDSGQAPSVRQVVGAGRADGINTALAPAALLIGVFARADESAVALAPASRHVLATGLSIEAATSFATTALLLASPGLAGEADTAQDRPAVHPVAPGLAQDTAAALGLTSRAVAAPGMAIEVDLTPPASARQIAAPARGDEIDSAAAPVAVELVHPGMATESDAAVALDIVPVFGIGIASEGDQAHPPTTVQRAAPSAATEQAAALRPQAVHAFAPGVAGAAAVALAPVPLALAAPGSADETETGQSLTPRQDAAPGMATEGAAALAASARHPAVPGMAGDVEVALGGALAQATAPGISVDAGAAFAPGAREIAGIGIAEEADLARPLNADRQHGMAAEGDQAIAPHLALIVGYGVAAETNAADSLTTRPRKGTYPRPQAVSPARRAAQVAEGDRPAPGGGHRPAQVSQGRRPAAVSTSRRR